MKTNTIALSVSLLLIGTLSISNFNPMTATSAQENAPIIDGSTSENALDWNGEYLGILPCGSCAGIKTEILLNPDLTYRLRRQYLGKNENFFETTGNFTWNTQGNIITLEGLENEPTRYLVGENRLFQLDMEGNIIVGDLADKYILGKVSETGEMAKNNATLTETYWKLTELNGKKIEDAPRDIYIMLKDNQRVQGFGGCNNLIGSYELKEGNRLNFVQIASTQMACEDMEKESGLFQVLRMVDNYNLTGNTLILNRARMAPLAVFEAVYLVK
ncbi:MAG: copper resistance protein NlpE N-terminal domain-containing protein [Cyanobacterium sp. T60_A2020_053]|nr:copper resistance protein NlpE N-terminal domain-containing protein [Cyanobacterium sp. T60_A2020_053]